MTPLRIHASSDTSLERAAAEVAAALADRRALAGAPLLLRGFALGGKHDLPRLLRRLDLEPMSYVGGNSPRTQLGGNVYTSTEFPPSADITLHQELSYEREVPDLLFFLCGRPAREGGATPLCDARELLESLPAGLVREFEERGLRYVQRLPADAGLGKSWRETFETDDRDTCAKLLDGRDVEHSWEQGVLVLTREREATRRHPRTGEKIWFNQADQWHPSSVGSPRAREVLEKMYGGGLPHDVTYADGAPVPEEFIAEISRTSRSIAHAEPWQAGDLLVLDNQATMHGRDSYSGERSIYVAMTAATMSP
ncbi:TauD/TfdA family dioxygenase [Nonomuraea sp. SBT364]|uniref:TauD/TfdA family dioxygenase n=1 Tax=Nonomuraea sp. SBT364 TaxID=1580530 RepID=UPI00066CC21D|nr:TauD/TfdA family dioxygenase [Nonomuraea sp. SBT364]